jgi:hypothetical protein
VFDFSPRGEYNFRSTAQVTRLSACHSERSEESLCGTEIPRCTQRCRNPRKDVGGRRTLKRQNDMAKRKKKVLGQCRICGKQGTLSYEHVPNREAYNKETIIEYSWEDVFVKKEKAKGKMVQGGIGEYTLCEKCNNDTGHWYGGEYTGWARACFEFLKNRKPSSVEPDEAIITLHDVYPLRFLKQVVVCFFSVTPGLAQTHPGLVQYVLNKEEKHIPADCQFFLNFYFGAKPKLRRWPIAGKITVLHQEGKLKPVASSVISEITHPPFALVMSDEMGFERAENITPFTSYDYDQQAKNLTLKLQVIKGESTLPGSFE